MMRNGPGRASLSACRCSHRHPRRLGCTVHLLGSFCGDPFVPQFAVIILEGQDSCHILKFARYFIPARYYGTFWVKKLTVLYRKQSGLLAAGGAPTVQIRHGEHLVSVDAVLAWEDLIYLGHVGLVSQAPAASPHNPSPPVPTPSPPPFFPPSPDTPCRSPPATATRPPPRIPLIKLNCELDCWINLSFGKERTA